MRKSGRKARAAALQELIDRLNALIAIEEDRLDQAETQYQRRQQTIDELIVPTR